MVVQPDGKVVVVGATFRDFAPALARYKPNGTLNTSFSGDGRQTTDFGGVNEDPVALSRPTARSSSSGRSHRLQLRPRPLQPHGVLDTRFSGDGHQTTGFGGSSGRGDRRGDPGPDGKIVVAGTATDPSTGANPNFAIARYLANGALTPRSAATESRRPTSATPATKRRDRGPERRPHRCVGVTARGPRQQLRARPLQRERLAQHVVLRRRPADHRLRRRRRSYGVAIQANGEIVAAGGTESSATGGGFALARYNSSGALNPSFSGDGQPTTAECTSSRLTA